MTENSVIKGIAAYKARQAEQDARREAASKPKVQRANLEKDGDSFVFRFAQEIDPDAKNYNADRGIGFVNLEHNHPDPKRGWMNRANCSTDSQGACLPCEKVQDSSVEWADRKGWKQKEKFYVNVIAGEPRETTETKNGREVKRYFATDIDKETGDGVVYLLEQGTYNGIWDQLVENAVEDETITETFWKVTRKGSAFNDTKYNLTKLKALPKKAKDLSEFELYDIQGDVLQEVPYNQQAAFYFKGVSEVEDTDAREVVGANSGASSTAGTDEAW